jgi:hypothetical protein
MKYILILAFFNWDGSKIESVTPATATFDSRDACRNAGTKIENDWSGVGNRLDMKWMCLPG